MNYYRHNDTGLVVQRIGPSPGYTHVVVTPAEDWVRMWELLDSKPFPDKPQGHGDEADLDDLREQGDVQCWRHGEMG